jgi:hypothetical protein
MDRRVLWSWVRGVLVIALLAVAGAYIYDLGVAHGLAAGSAGTPLAGRDAPFIGPWRPWGWGFGFFPFFPFLFVLLWFVVLRGFLWRGRWYGRRSGGPWMYERGGVPPAFEEWHRRAHDQQAGPSAGTKA